jgi:hypothetical protein
VPGEIVFLLVIEKKEITFEPGLVAISSESILLRIGSQGMERFIG